MRPLLYSINVTLDGCVHHNAIPADEALQQETLQHIATPPRASAGPTPCCSVASPTR